MTDYYIKNGGNNNASGLDDANAWETYEKARTFANTNPVEAPTINFKGGDVFEMDPSVGDRWDVGWRAEYEANPVIIQSYGSGKATIQKVGNVANSSAFYVKGELSSGIKWAPHFKNLIILSEEIAGGDGISGNGGSSSGLVENCDIVGFYTGVGFARGSLTPEYWTIRNNNISHAAGLGGVYGPCQAYLVENNVFQNCGYTSSSSKDHHIYIGNGNGSTQWPVLSDCIIRGNTLYNAANYNGGGISGVAIVCHGRIENYLIENNHIIEPAGQGNGGGYGIQYNHAYSDTGEYADGLVIRGNTVENIGNLAIMVKGAKNVEIYDNVLKLSGGTSSNFVAGVSLEIGDDDDGYIIENVSVRNNITYGALSLLDTPPPTMRPDGVYIDSGALGTVVNEANTLIVYDEPPHCMITKMPSKGYLENVQQDGAFNYTYKAGNAPDTDSFTYKVIDDVGESSVATAVLTIDTGTVTVPSLGTLILPTATEGALYSFFVNTVQTGGSSATSWTLKSGVMGNGLTFNTTTSEISGTPVDTTTLTGLSFSATNGAGESNTTNTADLNVNAAVVTAPIMGTVTMTNATVGIAYDYDLNDALTGDAATSYVETSSQFPTNGLSFNTSTGHITGTPVADLTLSSLTFTASNSGGSSSESTPSDLVVDAASATQVLTLDNVDKWVLYSEMYGPADYSVEFDFAIANATWNSYANILGRDNVASRYIRTYDGNTTISYRTSSGEHIFTVPAMSVDTFYNVKITRTGTTVKLNFDGGSDITSGIADSDSLVLRTINNSNGSMENNGLQVKNLIFNLAGTIIKFNIDSGSTTTDDADIGTATMTYNNIVAGDWS